jgi:enoyl-CoA hydratase
MKENIILTEKRGRVLRITLNAPEVMNALTGEMRGAYSRILDVLENDDAIDIVILTGNGKAFIAGADIKAMLNMTMETAAASAWDIEKKLHLRMAESDKIFIAAINGYALGGGLEMALACDLRIASDRAKFALPETALGILPGGGGTQRLPRVVGLAKAKELIFTGRVIGAAEAEKIGLVNRVTAPERLLDEAFALADEILKNSMASVRSCKRLIEHSMAANLEAGLTQEKALFGKCFEHPDQKEGMSAFIEKRLPVFTRSVIPC